MPPKTERFEMRLDEDTLAQVDRWRGKQPDLPSRAEAMRRLIERGLTKAPSEAVQLTDGDKLNFLMLREIYQHLGIERGEIDPEFVADAIFGGHYWALKWDNDAAFHDHEDSVADVRFVVDVLDMWSFLEGGFGRLSEADKAAVARDADPFGEKVRFDGFDGNEEANYMVIADFLVEKMGRFVTFKGRALNSHRGTVEQNRQMLGVFKPIRSTLTDGRGLNAGQITDILKARIYVA